MSDPVRILRFKRRRDEPSLGELVVGGGDLEGQGTDELNGAPRMKRAKPDAAVLSAPTAPKRVFCFAATLEVKDATNKVVLAGISSKRKPGEGGVKAMLAASAKRTRDERTDTRRRRLFARMLDDDDEADDEADADDDDDGEEEGAQGAAGASATKKGTAGQEEDALRVFEVTTSAPRAKQQRLTCNGVPVIREYAKVMEEKRQEAETDYVYDVYYEANEALDSEDEDNVPVVNFDEDLVVEDEYNDEQRLFELSDDSNEEDNWRNDYPSERTLQTWGITLPEGVFDSDDEGRREDSEDDDEDEWDPQYGMANGIDSDDDIEHEVVGRRVW